MKDTARPLSIVIADDHSEFRRYLARFIRQTIKGVEVVAQVRDGYEAIAAAQLLHPEVILLDITMQDISGLEAATRIKEKCPQTKIVFVTIHEEQTYKALADILQVEGFVCKSGLEENLPSILNEINGKVNEEKAKYYSHHNI